MTVPALPGPSSGFDTFGDLLRYLRRRSRLTQRDLSIAVGYSEAQVSRLESGYRPPDLATLAALFIPALHLEDEPDVVAQLLGLASLARGEPLPERLSVTRTVGLEITQETAAMPWEPGQARQSNLTHQLTSFVGRQRELAEVRRRLTARPGGPRLVTLAGAGGCGKTRLALETAAQLLPAYPDGVWLAELAPVAAEGVPQAVALALGLEGEVGPEPAARLAGYLSGKRLLLILDNCEHVVAALALALLQRCPGVHQLATSRETLGLAGEMVLRVPPLSLPPHPAEGPASVEAVNQFEAVQLFVERAQAAFPAFALNPANGAAVAQVVRQLDGLPLAIELAAARVPVLRVEAIAARLKEDLALLRTRQRGTPARQQALWATLDWSYNLLSETERALLRRLAVFASGWTLEAAAAVAPGGEPGQPADTAQSVAVLDLLAQLADKSLVVVDRQPHSDARYHLLETTRQYAAEKLAEASDEPLARDAHLAYYVDLAEQSEPALRGHGQAAWLRRLDREHDNLRVALAWAIEHQEAEAALRLAGALYDFWHIRGFLTEGRHWLKAALALSGPAERLGRSLWQARALRGCGALAMWLGDFAEAQARLDDSLALYRELRDLPGQAYTYYWLAGIAYLQSDILAARSLYAESLAVSTAAEDAWGMGNATHCLGHVLEIMHDRAGALKLYEQSVALLRETGDLWNLTHPLDDLAWQVWLEGDGRRAWSLLTDNLTTFNDLGGRAGMAMTLDYLCYITTAQGDLVQAQAMAAEMAALRTALGFGVEIAAARARQGDVAYWQGAVAQAGAHFDAALDLFRQHNDRNGVAWVQTKQAALLYRSGQLEAAQALLETCLSVLAEPRYPLDLAQALFGLADVFRAQGQLERAADHYGRSLKLVIQHGAQAQIADHLEGLAKTAQAGGQAQRAAHLLGAAAALRERLETPVLPVERAEHDAHRAAVQTALGQLVFEAAWQTGYGLSHAEAAQLALADNHRLREG